MSKGSAVAIDFETFYDTHNEYTLGGVKGKPGMSVWSYLHDPRFRAYWVAFHSDDLSYSGPVESAPWPLLHGRPLISHNASFDHTVLEFLQERGVVQDLATPSMYDTADAVAYFQEPRSLDRALATMLGITHEKAVRTAMDGRTLESLSADERRALERYGAGDAEGCYRLWVATKDRWPLTEQRISALNRRRGQQGLHLDVPRLDAAIAALELAHFELLKAMPWVLAGGKPLSMEAIREHGRFCGIPVPASLAADCLEAVAWEAEYAKQFPWVAAIRGYRRINSLMLKLRKWKRDLRPDGTAPFSLKYFGAAATGRFSGSGGFNLQNLPRNPAVLCENCWNCQLEDLDDDSVIDDDYNVEDPCPLCGAKKRFVIDVRGMIIAGPGRKLIIADYSQIEARILLWRVNDQRTLDMIRKEGYHIYEAFARTCFGWTGAPGTLKKTDKALYSSAKSSCLGGGYGAGKIGFARSAKQFAKLELSPEESQRMVDTYRSVYPLVVQHWRWHESWFRVSAIQRDTTHEVALPGGRHIRYFDPRVHLKKTDDGDRAELVAEIVHGARGGKGTRGQTRTFFGGKLTENEMQAAARDAMVDGDLAAEDAGIHGHFTVHDEVVMSADADNARDALHELEHILPAATTCMPGCPLAVEGFVADRYAKD